MTTTHIRSRRGDGRRTDRHRSAAGAASDRADRADPRVKEDQRPHLHVRPRLLHLAEQGVDGAGEEQAGAILAERLGLRLPAEAAAGEERRAQAFNKFVKPPVPLVPRTPRIAIFLIPQFLAPRS